MLAGNQRYGSLSILERHRTAVFIVNFFYSYFIFNFEHVSLNWLGLIFHISVVSRLRWILVSSFICFYERFPRSVMHTPLLPRQIRICFLKTLMQTVIQTFLYLFYLLIKKINWYLLTCAINATCKESNS